MSDNPEWWIYRSGTTTPRTIHELPPPPPWRQFGPQKRQHLSEVFQASPEEIEMINAALYLRRPLLITGRPGVGKSSLARSVAHELGLGEVLIWAINSRSTLTDGLYHYDAIGRLQQANMRGTAPTDPGRTPDDDWRDVGDYIRLGPLGTALVGTRSAEHPDQILPRVLLIDEFDKSDIDLPNDLLHLFEEGEFEIPVLRRLPDMAPPIPVSTWDGGKTMIERGQVQCQVFPFVVITSNGERTFPPAFLRRCLRLELQPPDDEKLRRIVRAHLGPEAVEQADFLIKEFVRRRDEEQKNLATDQLLNAIYLVLSNVSQLDAESIGQFDRGRLLEAILRELNSDG